MARKTGKIRNWNEARGFGFIRPDDGSKDVFLHRSEIRGLARSTTVALADGAAVEFDTTESPKGPRAADVVEL